jgi:hypothetical protein
MVENSGYGDVNPVVAPFGHGGMRNFIVDDTFGDDMPFPYYDQIVEVKKTGPGVHTFYMPPAGQIQCGSCLHFIYSTGDVDITFGIQPGGDPDVIINGANSDATYVGHALPELFLVTAEKGGWRVWKFGELGGALPAFNSVQPEVTVGPALQLDYSFPIPGNVISSTNQQDVLYIRVDLTHDTGGPNDETIFAFQQGINPPVVLFQGQCPSVPAPSWLEISVYRDPIADSVNFHFHDTCSGGAGVVGRFSSAPGTLDLTLPWNMFFATENTTIETTLHMISYEAKRA